MKRALPFILVPLLLAGCSGPGVSRNVCPASELANFVGRPVVDLAANDKLRPMRLVRAGEKAEAERADRLTISSDGRGRIAALSCG